LLSEAAGTEPIFVGFFSTRIHAGVNDTTGIAVVEVYALQ
jgi:hypothetical protein